MRRLFLSLLVCAACFAQEFSDVERKALGQSLSEAGNSAVEIIRALENHLAKYPATSKRPEIENLLVKAAMETRDDQRIILYGERALKRDQNDQQVLDQVTRALLVTDAKDTSERALKYAQRYEQLVGEMRGRQPKERVSPAQYQEDLDRALSGALAMQAQAIGNLGDKEKAIELAKKSYATYPAAEAARELARWLHRSNKDEEAIRYLAEAFVLPDPRNSPTDRAGDRKNMGELYAKLKGSEAGLGDLILQAYDRTAATETERQAKRKAADPNVTASAALDFTLPGLNGSKLALASLRGKAVVFDFWATWCIPCRAQHPLYEQVKKKYASNADVVFLSVNTDEDRTLVEPFVKDQKWDTKVYFEDGMSRKLDISSIPMTLVINRKGDVSARLNGFVPDRFVDMLSERIDSALK